ncbi:uncharacterized protein LOC110065474 [Orbicella faveolata]|uniref:uncharacterized protein LOC110065474 n=1 Tax=Orbicella faveolata TaxID=48498 RepID=UPI0009E4E029|nr:uncharacterized protein LOC110065474 [Orbicella faveolata]
MARSYFHVAIIVVALFIARGDSLSCYKCTSEDSAKDCKSKMESITCPSGTLKCLTGTFKCTQGSTKTTIYYKRCNAPNLSSCGASPQDLPKCPTSPGQWETTEIENCCTGDNCNSGSSHSINQVMLGICMAFGFWLLAFIH